MACHLSFQILWFAPSTTGVKKTRKNTGKFTGRTSRLNVKLHCLKFGCNLEPWQSEKWINKTEQCPPDLPLSFCPADCQSYEKTSSRVTDTLSFITVCSAVVCVNGLTLCFSHRWLVKTNSQSFPAGKHTSRLSQLQCLWVWWVKQTGWVVVQQQGSLVAADSLPARFT